MSARKQSEPAKAGKDATRREEILRIAAQTFAERGVKGSTTREIAERASMQSGSLYYYFPSKESMALEAVTSYLRELMEAYETAMQTLPSAAEQLRELFRASLEVSARRGDEVVILYQDWHSLSGIDGRLDATMSEVEQLWLKVIRTGIESGELRSDLDPRLVYRTIMGAISWVPRWYRPGGTRSIAEIADTQADVIIHGLQAR
jgi:AcrR family transcriptional regulator